MIIKKEGRYFFIIIGLIGLYATGVGVRRVVLQAQYERFGADLPFTLESALAYRLLDQVYVTGDVPDVDRKVQYPEGVRVKETYTIGSEYLYAWLAKVLPLSDTLTEEIRWIQNLWFCLGIPFLAVWVAILFRSWRAGGIAALFYAVSAAAVVRSTGQEISRENFALPLLIGHLASSAVLSRNLGRSCFWLLSGISALLLGAALMTWDMIQFYLLPWMILAYVRLLRGCFSRNGREIGSWLAVWAVLLLCGWYNPYLRAHHYLGSPVMMLGYGIVLGIICENTVRSGLFRTKRKQTANRSRDQPVAIGKAACRYRIGVALLAVAPLCLWFLCFRGYSETYQHFFDLLWAKIRYLNMKPLDPSALSFNQRIMWVPALHSANLRLTLNLFPTISILTLAAVWVGLPKLILKPHFTSYQLLVFYIFSIAAFWFFVRFQVFAVIFSVALIGWLSRWALERRGWATGVVLGLILLSWVCEAAHTIKHPERWARTRVYYPELKELVTWLEHYAAPNPVLANIGVSGSILTYGRCPIVLHPKFEHKTIRNRVAAYGEELFKGTEKSFNRWADAYGARYYVYSRGEFSPHRPEYQMRYFVDALAPSTNAPAWLFEHHPEKSACFRYVWGNRKYRVFKIIDY